MSRSLWFTV